MTCEEKNQELFPSQNGENGKSEAAPQISLAADMPKKQDIDSRASERKGTAGFVEGLLRRFRVGFHVVALLILYAVSAVLMGLALVPSIYLFTFVLHRTQAWSTLWHYAALGSAGAGGYFLFGFTLILIIPLFNFLMPLRLKPWRGIYYSMETIPWYIHNAFTYIVRYTFLEFITPTPLNILFFRLMGMKIGKDAMINTSNISDPCLIELGDKVTIGGSATVVCHYAAGGFLIIAPVRIGKGATVGMKATVMGDVEIGEKAKVLPNSFVMPKSRIPAGEIWGGVPAQRIREAQEEK